MDGAFACDPMEGATARDGALFRPAEMLALHHSASRPLFFGGVDDLGKMIAGLPEQVALVDESWTIIAVNDAWQRAVDALGLPGLLTGDNYRETCARWSQCGHPPALAVMNGILAIDRRECPQFRHVYVGEGPTEGHDYNICLTRFESGGRNYVMVARHEVTALRALERQCRRLGSTILRTQEDERRRIGRDLHDSTSQLLVGLQLAMIRLKSLHCDTSSTQIFSEMEETIDNMHREIRAIAYVLHPPMLERGKLPDALDALARGFSARTGLRVDFATRGRFSRRSATTEATLYRVAQEALTNVYQHAAAGTVVMRLIARGPRYLHLIVADDGIGFASRGGELKFGVGLAGMRSRIVDLGGRFSITRVSGLTRLHAAMPAHARSNSPSLSLCA